MEHVVHVESSYNPYAIGVVGGRLVRQPKNVSEAIATVRMLESRGFNFSVGLAQVNRYNLNKYGLDSYEKAFEVCPNLQAGSRILAECYQRSGNDWGKSFSCYYSGNFTTGFRHGYVQKIYASMDGGDSYRRGSVNRLLAIPLAVRRGGGDEMAVKSDQTTSQVSEPRSSTSRIVAAQTMPMPSPQVNISDAPLRDMPIDARQSTSSLLQPNNASASAPREVVQLRSAGEAPIVIGAESQPLQALDESPQLALEAASTLPAVVVDKAFVF